MGLKHASPSGRGGEVRVSLKTGPDGQTRLGVSDDGVGLPADLKTRQSRSLGLQLVGDLTRQFRGALETGPGAAFAVTFRPRMDGSLARRSQNGE
jgi:two-component sensor histidine kinase